ncbi:hypothetical protein QT711_14460 [Sporosarcina saromensis]|uniref:Lipoprotein n=1 Tax=Sporosarcina saromensis TaxID=359365 RepID=A0ABU4GFM1_9BACL|nr:hypothetical protein [Sporosarcina saromensis]MDW0114397.1 hypothetical protein [Sporosarcina saromensis]
MSIVTLLAIVLVGTSACANTSNEAPTEANPSKSGAVEGNNDGSVDASANTDDEDLDTTSSEQNASEQKTQKDSKPLSQYSNEHIEYARVWLQLGPNQDIDELNVRHIPAGEPINPDDDTSADYPEDVIQLAGSRLVDGSVTYSRNGDGTITVYNVPLRWDGNYPAGEDFYLDILANTKLVSIDPNEDEKVIALIKLIKLQQN